MDGLVTMSEFCKILSVSRSTLYRMIDSGMVPMPGKLGAGGAKDRLVWRESTVKKVLNDIVPVEV